MTRAARDGAGVAAALGILVLAVFGQTAGFGFVNFDDPQYVLRNPLVLGGLSWRGAGAAFTSLYAANWHPLTWLSHMADVSLFGLDAGAHHAVNVAFHLANALLLFRLLRVATGATVRAAVVAALFAVHPLHVESVAWISERKDVLSTFLLLLTLIAWVRHARRPRAATLAGVCALFALGLLAKPMLVTVPAVLLLLDGWPLGRAADPDVPGEPGRVRREAVPGLLREKLPLLALSAASCAVTLVAQARGGAMGNTGDYPFWPRLANAAVSYVTYLAQALWPARLAAFYPHPTYVGQGFRPWQPLAAALLLAAITAVAWATRRERPHLLFGWLWYLGTLVPVIGLVQVGMQAHADRYTYVPLVGILVAVIWEAAAALERIRWGRAFGLGLAGVAVLACAIVAHGQAATWRDSLALRSRQVEVNPDDWASWLGLGMALDDAGRLEEALRAMERARALAPVQGEASIAWNSGGVLLARLGRLPEAAASFRGALALEPDSTSAWLNLGSAQEQLGDPLGAADSFAQAIRLAPGGAAAWAGMAR
ncbi:MAG TPA: tetratricopeptide repeat protein, partial [Anaeromyxobacter sp.]